jgi:hypothetical protein
MTQFMRGLPGPVTAMAYAGGMSAHLADIEKLSNGFIVRFHKAQKVPVKRKTIDTLGFDDETKEIIRIGLEKMKEGEQWKGVHPEVMEALEANGPLERWITTPMAIACKDETELLEAIRSAVTAHAEIERLMLSGEFGGVSG